MGMSIAVDLGQAGVAWDAWFKSGLNDASESPASFQQSCAAILWTNPGASGSLHMD
jgi:hypothetical protein